MSDLYGFGHTIDETLKTMKETIDVGECDRMFVDTYHWLKILKDYIQIGTVEECRAAMEKQKPVRVEYKGSLSEDGFCNYRMARCPKCGEWRRDSDKDDNIYCSKCGSKLDWSEEE